MKTKNKRELTHVGYYICGESRINLWGGGQGTIEMTPTYLPKSKLSKSNMIRCINDGQFGCESIDLARLWVYDVYNDSGNEDAINKNPYKVYNRTFDVKIKKDYDKLVCSGV